MVLVFLVTCIVVKKEDILMVVTGRWLPSDGAVSRQDISRHRSLVVEEDGKHSLPALRSGFADLESPAEWIHPSMLCY